MKRNYHMLLTPIRRRGRKTRWLCEYCGQVLEEDQLRSTDCPHVYPVCEHCGGCEESNECKPDCSGIAAILSDPSIYVAGFPPEPEQ